MTEPNELQQRSSDGIIFDRLEPVKGFTRRETRLEGFWASSPNLEQDGYHGAYPWPKSSDQITPQHWRGKDQWLIKLYSIQKVFEKLQDLKKNIDLNQGNSIKDRRPETGQNSSSKGSSSNSNSSSSSDSNGGESSQSSSNNNIDTENRKNSSSSSALLKNEKALNEHSGIASEKDKDETETLLQSNKPRSSRSGTRGDTTLDIFSSISVKPKVKNGGAGGGSQSVNCSVYTYNAPSHCRLCGLNASNVTEQPLSENINEIVNVNNNNSAYKGQNNIQTNQPSTSNTTHLGYKEYEDLDEHITWPEGHYHYIDVHNVSPSKVFYEYVRDFPESVIQQVLCSGFDEFSQKEMTFLQKCCCWFQ